MSASEPCCPHFAASQLFAVLKYSTATPQNRLVHNSSTLKLQPFIFAPKKSLTRRRMKLLRQMQDIQDKIMRSFANSPPLAIWNFASRSETCRFFFSSPETS